jgi:hypothetical protein
MAATKLVHLCVSLVIFLNEFRRIIGKRSFSYIEFRGTIATQE